MNLTKLNCPECGAELQIPDNLAIAHCIYCGSKVVLGQEVTSGAHAQQECSHYIELCNAAISVKNYDEALGYCNQILESDPWNIFAWKHKAISVFWSKKGSTAPYEEAMGYLKKVSDIAPEDTEVAVLREQLTRQEIDFLIRLAGESWMAGVNAAKDVYAEDRHKLAAPAATQAMNYLLYASNLSPNDMGVLECIDELAKNAHWVNWSETVHAKVDLLKLLQRKKDATERLPRLGAELVSSEEELAHARLQKGILAGARIRSAEQKVSKIKLEIERLEQAANTA